MNDLRDYLRKSWLVIIFVFLFISGCAFSGSESKVDSFSEINEQKIGTQFETIEPIKTDPTENVVNTPSPVQPVQTKTPEDTGNEIKFSSDSFMNGKIVFQWVSRNNTNGGYKVKKLMLMDGNNYRIRYIGDFSGTPAISSDGTELAIGCPPSTSESGITEVCIVNIELIEDGLRQYPEKIYYYSYSEVIETRLAIPEECWQYQYDYIESRFEGILSLTWSPMGDRLAVVCGDLENTEVCILPLEGESWCWDHTASEDVYHVAWSPVEENTLVVSRGLLLVSEIYLVDQNGNNKKYLANGWSPEWSPDGTQIVYVERKSDIFTDIEGYKVVNTSIIFEGIATINLNGTGHELIYQYDPEVSESYIHLDRNGVYDQVEANRLAWSPDGNFIIFSGNDYSFRSRLYRLDIKTGDVISLTDPVIFDHWVTEADWGL